jgi:hypothetical protein
VARGVKVLLFISPMGNLYYSLVYKDLRILRLKMKRTALNYIIDMGMLLSFIAVLLTGIFKFPILLRMLARRGVYLPSNGITLVHEWAGALMAVCILLHLILHWKWVLSLTKRIFSRNRSTNYKTMGE